MLCCSNNEHRQFFRLKKNVEVLYEIGSTTNIQNFISQYEGMMQASTKFGTETIHRLTHKGVKYTHEIEREKYVG